MSEQFSQSPFDPNLFLDAQTAEPNVKRPPLPPENPETSDGTYLGVIRGVKATSGIMEKGDRAGQPWLSMVVPIHIEVPPKLQDAMKLPGTVILSDSCFIDLTPANTIDNGVGKNRRQRQYRDALNMNNPGDVWSWRKAEGQPVRIKITHEIYNGEVQDRVGLLFKV